MLVEFHGPAKQRHHGPYQWFAFKRQVGFPEPQAELSPEHHALLWGIKLTTRQVLSLLGHLLSPLEKFCKDTQQQLQIPEHMAARLALSVGQAGTVRTLGVCFMVSDWCLSVSAIIVNEVSDHLVFSGNGWKPRNFSFLGLR